MTTSLTRRLGQLERVAEARRAPIRLRIHRIIRGRDADLSPEEIQGIVTRALGWPARITRLRGSGMSVDQITEHMLAEVPA